MARPTITPLHTRRPTPEAGLAVTPDGRVADVLCSTVVRIPLWFTAAQARRVAAHKGVDHLLVEEHGRVAGSISLTTLLQAPPTEPVARWMSRSQAHLTPDQPLSEAERHLRREGVGCLPVVAGGLLVGIVSLAEVAASVAHAA